MVAMTKIAKTAATVTFLMAVGLARPVVIEPDGTNVEARESLVHRA